jgi:methylmalonyl-CoA mutase cobalamin-binding domain/chain
MSSTTMAHSATAGAGEVGVSGFCRAAGVTSEYAYKRRCIETDKIMYHAHMGLSTWTTTSEALREVVDELSADGRVLDRFGLCLDRAISLPEERRHTMARETGPLLTAADWEAVGQQTWSQPHMGDFMIGTAASVENSARALEHGVTTIGNLGQFFTFDIPGGGDDTEVTSSTVRALRRMVASRDRGAVVHSDDGPAMQLNHYGNYLGWAALESHVIERMLGARLAHCFGGLVPQPRARALLALALPHLHEADAVGSMIYGNTVDYTKDLVHNQSVLSNYLLVDIATQLHRPTGHAVNPVPLTENVRIPDAADILEVQQLAREIEREARRSGDVYAWAAFEADAYEGVQYAREWAAAALTVLENDGVDVTSPFAILLALRRCDVKRLEARVQVTRRSALSMLEPWKAGVRRTLVSELIQAAPSRLDGKRIVLASLDVHDLVRGVLIKALSSLGAEVILLAGNSHPDAVIRSAVDEDVSVAIVSTYDGAALRQAVEMSRTTHDLGFDGDIIMGGVLNEDLGGPVPSDVTERIRSLGIHCIEHLRQLPDLLDRITDPHPGVLSNQHLPT